MSDNRVLLFTDIVDSTRINETLGDEAMQALWQAHDRLSRELLRLWSGREIGRSDGFLLLFDEVPQAIGFALAYHQALAQQAHALTARVGIHLGPVTLRENSAADREQGATPYEVDGAALPIAARIMSAAQGGQTLLSGAAAAALGEGLWALQSHGFWRLKGVAAPLEIIQVGQAGMALLPPPDSDKAYRVSHAHGLWLPRRDIRHSLPVERDAFVGRQSVLHGLARLIESDARLVSLLGIGGTGKTRLAIQFGWTWLGDFPGGVWFCDLTAARDIDGIVQAVAQGLQLPLGRGDPVALLGQALAGHGRCLVILDNFEQVAAHAAATLGRWLDSAAQARFIVTSRELLGLPGEVALPLAPLARDEAVALFERRAAAVRPGFAPDAAERATIARLVELLDGLPLAIELAAARVRVMSPATMLQRIGERFKLLVARAGRSGRQSTLRNAFDWSWDLLPLHERSALAQLSVFEGGFTLPAVEAVLDLTAQGGAPEAVDLLQSLVEKSLVRDPGGERFELLSMVQEYAREQLDHDGRFPGSGAAAALAAQARHFRYFAGLDEQAAVAQRCVELGNLHAACRHAAAQGDGAAAAGALAAAWAAIKLRGPYRSGLELADQVDALLDLKPVERAQLHWVAGSALYSLGQTSAAQARLEAGLALAQTAGDLRQRSRLHSALGEQLATAGQGDAAAGHLDAALALARGLGDRALQYTALNALGTLAHEQARLRDAREHYEEALSLARELGNLRWQGGLLGNLGSLWHAQGRLDEARAHYEQAVALARQCGDRRWEGNTLCNLGLLHHDEGRYDEASLQFQDALATARELGNPRLEGAVLCNLGLVSEAQGSAEAALDYQQQALVRALALGDPRAQGLYRAYLGRLYARLGHNEPARDCLRIGEAQLRDAGDQFSLGLLLCSLAELEHRCGDAQAALQALQRAEGIAQALSAEPGSELMLALRSVRELGG